MRYAVTAHGRFAVVAIDMAWTADLGRGPAPNQAR
jgi:hypothetical protein